MPAVVGPVQLGRLFPSGVAGIGDRAFITPQTSSKTIMGSGALNTGNFAYVENQFDITTTYEGAVLEEPTILNN